MHLHKTNIGVKLGYKILRKKTFCVAHHAKIFCTQITVSGKVRSQPRTATVRWRGVRLFD